MRIATLIFICFTLIFKLTEAQIAPLNLKDFATTGPFLDNGSELLMVANGVHKITSTSTYWQASSPGVTVSNSIIKNNNAIFINSSYEIHKSTDNGLSWTEITPQSLNSSFGKLYTNQGKLFLSTYNKGIYSSSDDGVSWTLITNGISDSVSVNAFVAYGDTIIVSVSKGWPDKRLLKSINNGVSFTQLSNTIEYSNLFYDNGYLIGSSYLGNFKSTNGGTTWSQVSNSGANKILKINNTLYGFHAFGLYKSNDMGNSWVQQNSTNFSNDACYWNNKIYANSSGNIIVSDDLGNTFNYFNGGVATSNSIYVFTDGTKDYVLKNNGNIYYSDNGFINYHSIDPPVSNLGNSFMLYGNLYSCQGFYNLNVSTDTGRNWISNIYVASSGSYIKGMCNDNNYLYLALSNAVLKSSDSGNTWQSCTNPSTYNKSITNRNNVLYIPTNSGLFASANQAQSWNNLTSGVLSSNSINDFDFNTNSLYITNYENVYKSDNNGQTWTPILENIFGNKQVEVNGNNILIFNQSNNTLYFSNNGGSTFSYNLSISNFFNSPNTGIGEVILTDNNIYIPAGEAGVLTGDAQSLFTGNNENISKAFTLYPNPTSDIINFNYSFNEIRFFNSKGQLVKLEKCSKNSNQISIKDLANDIYFVEIISGAKKITTKVVISK